MDLKNNYLVTLVKENLVLLNQFDEVYLFGSILDENKVPSDVDILLVYYECLEEITEISNRVLSSLEEILNMSVDLTILSMEEVKDTQFLHRILPNCLRLK